MRWLIESLIDDHPMYWRWVGGIFAFYVAVMIFAAGLFMAHQSAKRPTQGSAVQESVGGKQRSIAAAAMPFSQVAAHH
jgi:hypothetical protein